MAFWLQTRIVGNTLLAWLLAALWLVLAMLLTVAAKHIIVKRLRAIATRTSTHWDDALVHAIAGTYALLVGAMALYPLVENLNLPPRGARWASGIAAIGLFVQIGLWAARFLDFWIKSSRDRAMQHDPETATGLAAMSFLARLILWSLVALLLLDNLGFNVTTLLAGLGVGGIAVGLALQNILGDLFSSLSIVLDKPFQIGHFVVIDGFSGTVDNIGLKTTRIRSISGEILVFSNTDLTKARLRNYKFMQERRVLFTIGVTYNTAADMLERVPGIVQSIIVSQEQARFERAHLKDFGDSSLNFEVVYWMKTSDYGAYMDTQQAINLALMRAFGAMGVEFAFPTRTVQLQLSGPLPVALAGLAGNPQCAETK